MRTCRLALYVYRSGWYVYGRFRCMIVQHQALRSRWQLSPSFFARTPVVGGCRPLPGAQLLECDLSAPIHIENCAGLDGDGKQSGTASQLVTEIRWTMYLTGCPKLAHHCRRLQLQWVRHRRHLQLQQVPASNPRTCIKGRSRDRAGISQARGYPSGHSCPSLPHSYPPITHTHLPDSCKTWCAQATGTNHDDIEPQIPDSLSPTFTVPF